VSSVHGHQDPREAEIDFEAIKKRRGEGRGRKGNIPLMATACWKVDSKKEKAIGTVIDHE